jgi:hypothetical protein
MHYYWTYPYWTVKYPVIRKKKKKIILKKHCSINVNRVLYKFQQSQWQSQNIYNWCLGIPSWCFKYPVLYLSANQILFSQNLPLEISSFLQTWKQSRNEIWFTWQWQIRLLSLRLWQHVVWQEVTRVHPKFL